MNAPSDEAWNVLSESDKQFLYSLPHRVELHAHLNGSIPLATLEELASERSEDEDREERGDDSKTSKTSMIQKFRQGVQLDKIGDFFHLFPAIYALTDRAEAVKKVTVSVLLSFLAGEHPNATAVELRSTPRATPFMNRREYVDAVVAGIDDVESQLNIIGQKRIGLILSIDRRMNGTDAHEIVDLAKHHRVVGVDLCGDMFRAHNLAALVEPLSKVKEMGKGLTMHLYETPPRNDAEEDLEWQLLKLHPHRLGHATYLSPRALEVVKNEGICVELCLSSNVICKTANSVNEHHIVRLLEEGVKVAVCTDDPLPFKTTLIKELGLLLAPKPHGLAMARDQVRRIADTGSECMFSQE